MAAFESSQIAIIVFVFLLVFYVVTLSSLTIHETSSPTSQSYKKVSKGLGYLGITGATAVVISIPFLLIEDVNVRIMVLLALILSVILGSIGILAIYQADCPSDDDKFQDFIYGVSGTGLAFSLLALVTIIAVIIMMLKVF